MKYKWLQYSVIISALIISCTFGWYMHQWVNNIDNSFEDNSKTDKIIPPKKETKKELSKEWWLGSPIEDVCAKILKQIKEEI